MYVARLVSEYRKNPDALSLPPDGPNSGFMVIQDEDSETYSCFGFCRNQRLEDLPLPQNKVISIRHVQKILFRRNCVSLSDVIFIPVLDLPLSSNRYYCIHLHGNYSGELFTASRQPLLVEASCYDRCIKQIIPKPFDPRNQYQQFEFRLYKSMRAKIKGRFVAKCVMIDGCPPYLLQRRDGYSELETKSPKGYKLNEALGLDASLRARLPGLDIRPSCEASEAVVVGKWYTPFMFVKEGLLRDQVTLSTFYEVTLEQKWERILFCRKSSYHREDCMSFVETIDQEMVHVFGNKAIWKEGNEGESVIWFSNMGRGGEAEIVLGLAVELVERMKWEQERGGWRGGNERRVKVEISDKLEGNGEWTEFGCYVLVESFVFKRMDGTLVLSYDFRYTQHLKRLWE